MNPIQSTETIRIIHDDMVRRELRRSSPDGYRFTRGGATPAGMTATLRRLAGRMLIRTGTMIARSPKTIEPAGTVTNLATYRRDPAGSERRRQDRAA